MTSKIKVDNINKVSDDSNIINKCGTTVTVGAASVRTPASSLKNFSWFSSRTAVTAFL